MNKKETEVQKNGHLALVSSCYWLINQRDYIVDGHEVKRGRMSRIEKGSRAVMNPDWRLATHEEIESKQWYKGHFFNLMAWR